MRNLKRALSLALASVMVLGMMVVGSSASYKDVDETDNLEAIEVLQAVKIMVGDENGNFNPDANVTRNEMAVIMSNLLNLDYDYYRGINPFTDVPTWAAPYVAACAAEGVTSGIGNGLYGGDNNVTAAQAALMVLKALGYFQYNDDFGDDWQVSTIRQASYIDLFDQINANAETALTRGQVAQMVLNGLKANIVDFTGDVGREITVGGVTLRDGYRPEYTERTNAAIKYNSIDTGITNIGKDDKYYVQLGEELYNGDLKLKNDTDVFGRPARTWSYKSQEVGTYVKDELLVAEYSVKVTGKTLYELITKSVLDDSQVYIYIDGVSEKSDLGSAYFTKNQIAKTNDDKVGATGNGVTTQVFVDTKTDEITIAIINTYLAKADEDYDEKNDEVDLTVYSVEDKSLSGRTPVYVKNTSKSESMTAEGEDFAIENVKEDDLFLVTIADGELQSMTAPEIIADATVTNFKDGKYVTAEGTKYDYADTVQYDEEVLDDYDDKNMKEVTYNVILDKYGYMIGIELVEEPDQYLFLTGIDLGSSNLSKKNADANVIFLDGTMKTVTVNMTDSELTTTIASGGKLTTSTDDLSKLEVTLSGGQKTRAQLNTWCTYTVDKNGVYTLEQVAPTTIAKADNANNVAVKVAQAAQDVSAADVTIDKKNVSLNGAKLSPISPAPTGFQYDFDKVYGNDDTVYLNVDEDDLENISDKIGNSVRIIDDVTSVVTGIKNVKLTVEDIADDGSYEAPVNEIYTLYKDNGYIIAAVVIGEDDGVSSNYAYVTSKTGRSGVEQEAYDAAADEYTWIREVVVNGEIVELKEVGEHLKYLDSMAQGKWYEIKYDADGNVRSVTSAGTNGSGVAPILFTYSTTDKFANTVKNLSDTAVPGKTVLENNDTVVLSDTTTATKLTYKAGTLYTNTAQTEGFSVSPDVKVVLCLADNSTPVVKFDDVDDSYTGYSGLEKALRNLNAADTFSAGTVEVNAILENGVATSIILNDTNAAPSNANDAARPVVTVTVSNASATEGDTVTFTASVSNAADCGTLTYQWYKDADSDNQADDIEKIAGATEKTYTISSAVTGDAGTYICKVTNTDTSSKITGKTQVSGENYTALSVNPKAPETMAVSVIYELADGTFVAQTVDDTVQADSGKSYATVNAVAPAGYKTVGAASKLVSFVANGFAEVKFTVAALSSDTSVTATATAGASNSGVTDATVSSTTGTTVTLTLTGSAAEGDTITVSLTVNDANASIDNNSVTLTYTSGAWVADVTATVTAENGTIATVSFSGI